MDFEAIENAIYEKLLTDITDYSVEKYPDDPMNYKLLHPKGAVLVKWSGENRTEPKIIQQGIIHKFTISIVSRNLRTNTGAYGIIKEIQESVTALNDYGLRIYKLSSREIGYDDKKWYHESVYLVTDVGYVQA